ncbi:PadR family transcriptional regulator [Nocardiopsis kunsanensis]|uniref:PadR family transcriptional regulator n=1 Tax=Nocardiopsis kunsanensis TaxID=141693 RepID=UPI0003478186|nr:helix-turn-helix transcriptional regulator [Nocardiopsis kunsanensis]
MRQDAVRGHLDGLLLAVLESGPLHGYAIITAVQQRSSGVLELRTGTIYPALNRLERTGLLHSSWQSVGERPKRCYELTDAGRRMLSEERSAWESFTTAIGSVLNPGTAHGAIS